MTIIWYMVPEIWSATDIIFCHSRPFFALLPLYGPKKSKLKKTKNGKNTWRYYHITKINDSHMTYGSSDTVCNGQNVLSFWTIFCPLPSLPPQRIVISHFRLFFAPPSPNIPKSQNLEKMKNKTKQTKKKHQEVSSFYICVPKIMIRWCAVLEIWCLMDIISFYFGSIFALLPP